MNDQSIKELMDYMN